MDFANAVHRDTGGIAPEVNFFSRMEHHAYRAEFEIRMRVLEGNLEKAIDLADSMMLRTRFDDEKRLYEVLAQTRSQMRTNLQEGGNTVALVRAMSYTFPQAHYSDLIHGIGQYRLLERLVDHFEEEKEHLRSTLDSLVSRIFTSGGLRVSATCRQSGREMVREKLPRITRELFADAGDRSAKPLTPPTRVDEAFTDASQIQYVAMSGDFSEKGYDYQGALRVFRCIMNYEYLWMNLRVRGGAYGCGCTVDRVGALGFSSYRDPNLERTLEIYRGVPDYLRTFEADERDMTRYIIGTFSELDAPLTPRAQGRRSLAAMLSDTTFDMVQRDRDEVLATGVEDIRALAPLVEAALEDAHPCVIGNEGTIGEASTLFGHTEAL